MGVVGGTGVVVGGALLMVRDEGRRRCSREWCGSGRSSAYIVWVLPAVGIINMVIDGVVMIN